MRAAKNRPVAKNWPKRCEEGLIVGIEGKARWGKFDPDTIYVVLQDGRNVPVTFKRGLLVP